MDFTLLVALSMQLFAQETVTGVATDATGPTGANVVVTNNGVQTGLDGVIAIKAKTGDVLVLPLVAIRY
jgi:hypothetical protein